MITIKIIIEKERAFPERELTDTERATVLSSQCDGENYYYYQKGDIIPIKELTLEQLIARRVIDIDFKTQEIIGRGFSFGGKQFSLSDNAQRNWIGIAAGIAMELYTEENFPFPLSTLSDEQYNLQWSDRDAFLKTISYTIGYNKTFGTKLKQTCFDAQSKEALSLVIDSRE